jgi:hypothetical protein
MPDNTSIFFDPAEDCQERSPREIFARQSFTPLY